MRRVYLDNSATTYTRREVLDAMKPYFSERFGNPSSMHGFGREARRALDDSRETIAQILRVKPSEIIFTAGGSEADNLALKGVAWAGRGRGTQIITSQIEHHAVINTCKWLETQGFEVIYLPVDKEGFVDLDALESAITEKTILISVMAGNNEVGTIQDIDAISKIADAHGVPFHTDAVQYAGYFDLRLDELPISMASLSAHKFYGPKGVGVLFLREGVKVEPLIHGGSQEWGRRAGTENVAGVVGMAKALELTYREMDEERKRLAGLANRLLDGILAKVEDSHLNGSGEKRLPNNLNIAFAGADAESILLQLDTVGIAVSSGSACASGSLEPSHVLSAMGLPTNLIKGSIRFSLGLASSQEDVDYTLEKLPEAVHRARERGRVGVGF